MAELTHFDERGSSRMVDVSDKDVSARSARASGLVRMEASTLALILDRGMAKGMSWGCPGWPGSWRRSGPAT